MPGRPFYSFFICNEWVPSTHTQRASKIRMKEWLCDNIHQMMVLVLMSQAKEVYEYANNKWSSFRQLNNPLSVTLHTRIWCHTQIRTLFHSCCCHFSFSFWIKDFYWVLRNVYHEPTNASLLQERCEVKNWTTLWSIDTIGKWGLYRFECVEKNDFQLLLSTERERMEVGKPLVRNNINQML